MLALVFTEILSGDRLAEEGLVKWAARLPDLTPCDFWLWGMVKERVYVTKPRNVRDPRQKIENVIATIP